MEDFKHYKINLFNALGRYFIVRPIVLIFIIEILIVFSIKWYYNISQDKFWNLFIGSFSFTFIFYLGPLLILIFNYILKNKRASLKIHFDKDIPDKIEYLSRGRNIHFKVEDIQNIEWNMSITSYENRYKWFFWDEYFYYKIILKDGSQIFVPCILCDSIDEIFENNNLKKIKRYYPI